MGGKKIKFPSRISLLGMLWPCFACFFFFWELKRTPKLSVPPSPQYFLLLASIPHSSSDRANNNQTNETWNIKLLNISKKQKVGKARLQVRWIEKSDQSKCESSHLESKSWILCYRTGCILERERERGTVYAPAGQIWRLMTHLGTGKTAGGWPFCRFWSLKMCSDKFQTLTNQNRDSFCNGEH